MRIWIFGLKSTILFSAMFLGLLAPSISFCSTNVDSLLNSHRYEEAIKELEENLKRENPQENQDLLYKLGKAYQRKGLIYASFFDVAKEVEKDYYEFLRSFGIKTYLSFYLGVCYFELGQYQKAIAEFNDFGKIKKLDKTFMLLSSIWIEASRFKLGKMDAVTKLEEIKIKNVNNPVVVSEAAYFLSYLQDNNKKALQFIQETKPPSQSFHNRYYRNLAYVYMRNDMLKESKKAYLQIKTGEEEIIAEINPDLKIFFYDLTQLRILASLNFYLSNQTLSQIMKDMVTHKRWQTVLFLRGQDAFYVEDFHMAIQLLEQSEHPIAKVYLGSAYYEIGQKSKAQSVWSEVEKASDRWALRELGSQYASLNVDQIKAIELCQRALDLTKEKYSEKMTPNVIKERLKYFRYLGWVYHQNGELRKAVKAFEEGYHHSHANDLDLYEPEFLNERAVCFYKNSKLNWPEAIETYFILMSRYPAVKQIHYALQGLGLDYDSGDIRY